MPSRIDIAFDDVHAPTETPAYEAFDGDAVVEFELLEAEHGSGAMLTRDDDPDVYDVAEDEVIEVRRTDRVVEVLRPR